MHPTRLVAEVWSQRLSLQGVSLCCLQVHRVLHKLFGGTGLSEGGKEQEVSTRLLLQRTPGFVGGPHCHSSRCHSPPLILKDSCSNKPTQSTLGGAGLVRPGAESRGPLLGVALGQGRRVFLLRVDDCNQKPFPI